MHVPDFLMILGVIVALLALLTTEQVSANEAASV